MTTRILPLFNLTAVLILSGLLSYTMSRQKSGFIVNQRLFNAFEGKIELENRLKAQEEANKKTLDSLIRLPADRNNILIYEAERRKLDLKVQELSARYTTDIWKRINEYVSAYGEEHGYDFIFGASGDGSLMYAREGCDITDEVIGYVNRKYNGTD